MKNRTIAHTLEARETMEGDGMRVRRSFPTPSISYIDPFLLLDEMGPIDFPPGSTSGFPEHPHRGFETVTYVLDGAMEHKDSRGNAGTLKAGDVQWMTAGAGVIHSEMPERSFMERGGRLHGFQLWINLPARDKMIPPHYQEIPSEHIPEAHSEDGLVSVRVIAGESLGKKAVIATRTPIIYLHITLKPGRKIEQPVPHSFTAFTYIINGEAQFDHNRSITKGNLILFQNDGETISIVCSQDATEPVQLLLIAGEPLNEPVARYGPFVMTNEEEIYQAIEDYRTGRMGKLE